MEFVNINPAAGVARRARYFPNEVAIRYEGGDLTAAALDNRAARLAAVLAAKGVEPGDRVAYAGLNSAAFLVTLIGTLRLGAIFVPLNFRLAGPELQQILEDGGARVIVAEPGHCQVIAAVAARTALKQFLLVDDDPCVPVGETTGPWQPWSGPIAATTPYPDIAHRGFDDPAILMYTSGTTGLPKGVILTHGNAWWNAVNVDAMVDTRRGDVTHAAAPLFHIGALNSFTLRNLVRGGTVVVRRGFKPDQAIDDYVRYRVNSTFGVPAMFAALARVPGFFDADLTALRSIIVAGAPVPPSLLVEFARHGVLLQQAWGLTETAPFATHLPVERTHDKLGSAGIPMPYTQVRVVDPVTGRPVPSGIAGEVVVRGPNVTPGYWRSPTATSAAFDSDGWFHSGDIGYVDEDGYLFIVDRLKDMIISGGENVYPAEVEAVLADFPGALDVAVVGIPDQQWGESVVAVMSMASGASADLNDVRDHAAPKLARYKLPTRLTVVRDMPRNASGKFDKKAIRQLVTHSGDAE
ncbi:AMP-binding protein [Micromonospora sp. NBC_01392]|uniref:AMP-binding protein n=1 Tax=Micromonospora sp. NBC_01392 TaxID=2903588 RepID=UPI00324977EE